MFTTILGEVSEATRRDLRGAMLRSQATFATYAEHFHRVGVSREDILRADPVAILERIPVLDAGTLHRLADESIAVCSQIVDIETSSGTTGRRKRRFITHDDDASETELLARLFGVCGIGHADSVACLDTGPLTLMVSFTKALDGLGVRESYAYCVSPDLDLTVEGLARLDPTVIVTIPSILDRCLPPLRRHFGRERGRRLKRIVYVGEPLSGPTRAALERELGLRVYGYYGASETSALGIECSAHDGLHLFTDRNVIELRSHVAGPQEGDILVTTLNQQGLPLFRYPLNDLISVRSGDCPCGLRFPRVDVKGRTDGAGSILGANVSYNSLRESAYAGVESPGPMEVVLTSNGKEKLTIVLPSQRAADARRIRTVLLKREPDLTYLVGARFLELELEFVDVSHFRSARKANTIVDRRGAAGAH